MASYGYNHGWLLLSYTMRKIISNYLKFMDVTVALFGDQDIYFQLEKLFNDELLYWLMSSHRKYVLKIIQNSSDVAIECTII